MKTILNLLFEHKTLDRETAREVLVNIARQQYNPSQIAAFLTVYLMRTVSLEELAGFRDALIELCIPVELDGMQTVDVCGTGGDSKDTFNISTLTAFAVAGAGYRVAKHGNYSVSSSCGSSNVLEYLGHRFTDQKEMLMRQIETSNICFLHAPLFHPAMKTVAPVRKELGVKTFFNMLGPLVNPVQPPCQLIGVFNLELARMYHYLLQDTGKSYTIIHGLDGYDELSLTGTFKKFTSGSEEVLKPEDLGFDRIDPAELYGGNTVKEAASVFMKVLSGEGSDAQHNVVAANAALAIQCLDRSLSIGECQEQAAESIRSGRALSSFRSFMKAG